MMSCHQRSTKIVMSPGTSPTTGVTLKAGCGIVRRIPKMLVFVVVGFITITNVLFIYHTFLFSDITQNANDTSFSSNMLSIQFVVSCSQTSPNCVCLYDQHGNIHTQGSDSKKNLTKYLYSHTLIDSAGANGTLSGNRVKGNYNVNIHNTDDIDSVLDVGCRLMGIFLFFRDLEMAQKASERNVNGPISSSNSFYTASDDDAVSDDAWPYLLFATDPIPYVLRRVRWLMDRVSMNMPRSSEIRNSSLQFQIVPDVIRRLAAIPKAMVGNLLLREHFITYRRPCDTFRSSYVSRGSSVLRGIFDTCVVWLPAHVHINTSDSNVTEVINAKRTVGVSSYYHYIMEPVLGYRDLRGSVTPNCFEREQTIGRNEVGAYWDILEDTYYNSDVEDEHGVVTPSEQFTDKMHEYGAFRGKYEKGGRSVPKLSSSSGKGKESVMTAEILQFILFGQRPANVSRNLMWTSVNPIISKQYCCRCGVIEKDEKNSSTQAKMGIQFDYWLDVDSKGVLRKRPLDLEGRGKVQREWIEMVKKCNGRQQPLQSFDGVNVEFLLRCMEDRSIALINQLNEDYPRLPAVYLVPRPPSIVGKSASEIMREYNNNVHQVNSMERPNTSSAYLISSPQPQPLVRNAICNYNTPLRTTLSHPSLYEFRFIETVDRLSSHGGTTVGASSDQRNEAPEQYIPTSTVTAELVQPSFENMLYHHYMEGAGYRLYVPSTPESSTGLNMVMFEAFSFVSGLHMMNSTAYFFRHGVGLNDEYLLHLRSSSPVIINNLQQGIGSHGRELVKNMIDDLASNPSAEEALLMAISGHLEAILRFTLTETPSANSIVVDEKLLTNGRKAVDSLLKRWKWLPFTLHRLTKRNFFDPEIQIRISTYLKAVFFDLNRKGVTSLYPKAVSGNTGASGRVSLLQMTQMLTMNNDIMVHKTIQSEAGNFFTEILNNQRKKKRRWKQKFGLCGITQEMFVQFLHNFLKPRRYSSPDNLFLGSSSGASIDKVGKWSEYTQLTLAIRMERLLLLSSKPVSPDVIMERKRDKDGFEQSMMRIRLRDVEVAKNIIRLRGVVMKQIRNLVTHMHRDDNGHESVSSPVFESARHGHYGVYPPLFGQIHEVGEKSQIPTQRKTTIVLTAADQFRAQQQDEDVFHYCAAVARKPISDDAYSSNSDRGNAEGSRSDSSTSFKTHRKIPSINSMKLMNFASGVPFVCYESNDIVCRYIQKDGIFERSHVNIMKGALGNDRNEVRLAATILKERELTVGESNDTLIAPAESGHALLKLLHEAAEFSDVTKNETKYRNKTSTIRVIPPVILWTPSFVEGLLQGIRRRIDMINKEIEEHRGTSPCSFSKQPPLLNGVSPWLYAGVSTSRMQRNDGTLARAWVASNREDIKDFEREGDMLTSLDGLPSLIRKPFENSVNDMLQLMPDGKPNSVSNNTKRTSISSDDVSFAMSRLSPFVPDYMERTNEVTLEAIVKIIPNSHYEVTQTNDDCGVAAKRDLIIHNKYAILASLQQSAEFLRSHISPMVNFHQRHEKALRNNAGVSGSSLFYSSNALMSTQFPEVLDRRVDVEFLSENSVPLFEAVKTYGESILQHINHENDQSKNQFSGTNRVSFPMLRMPTIISSGLSRGKKNSASTVRPLYNQYDNDVSLIDIGANVGLFSYIIRSESSVNTYMFEPQLANVFLLETTGCLNRVRDGSAWASAVEAIVATSKTPLVQKRSQEVDQEVMNVGEDSEWSKENVPNRDTTQAKVIFFASSHPHGQRIATTSTRLMSNEEKAALFSSTSLTAMVTLPSSSSSAVLLSRLRSIALCNKAPSSTSFSRKYYCTPSMRPASIFYGALGNESSHSHINKTLCVMMTEEINIANTMVSCNRDDVAKARIILPRLMKMDLTAGNPSSYNFFTKEELIRGHFLPFGFLTLNRLDDIVMKDAVWALDVPSPSDPVMGNFPKIFDDRNGDNKGNFLQENTNRTSTANSKSSVSPFLSDSQSTGTSRVGRLGLHPILLKRALKVIFDIDVSDDEYKYFSIPLSRSKSHSTTRRISVALSHLNPQFVKRFERLIKQEYVKLRRNIEKIDRDQRQQGTIKNENMSHNGVREVNERNWGSGTLLSQQEPYPSAVSHIYVNRLQSTRDLLRYVCIRHYDIKIDVEGFEPIIIQGASKYLEESLFRPSVILAEIRMSDGTVPYAKRMVRRPSGSRSQSEKVVTGNSTATMRTDDGYDYIGFYLEGRKPVILRNEKDVEEKVSNAVLKNSFGNVLWVRRGLEYLVFPLLPPMYRK